MPTIRIEIANWKRHQHYQTRTPPWIKLHTKLMQNRAFMALPAESFRLLVLLWVLASKENGVVEADTPEDLAFLLRMDGLPLGDLRVLLKAKFITVSKETLAYCTRDACLDEELDTEAELDTYKQASGREPTSNDVEAVDAWLSRDGRSLTQCAELIVSLASGTGLDIPTAAKRWREANGAPLEAVPALLAAVDRMPHTEVPDDLGPPGEREKLLEIGDPLVALICARDGVTESQVVAKASDYKGRRGKTYMSLRSIPPNRHKRLVHTVNELQRVAGVKSGHPPPRRDAAVEVLQEWVVESMEAERAMDRSGDVRGRLREAGEGPRRLRDEGIERDVLGDSQAAQPGPVVPRGQGGAGGPGPAGAGKDVAAGAPARVGAELLGPASGTPGTTRPGGDAGPGLSTPSGGGRTGVHPAIREPPSGAQGGGSDDARDKAAVQGPGGSR